MPDLVSLLADYFTLAEMAQQLNKSERTVIRYTQQPNGLPYVQLGPSKLFHRETSAKWISIARAAA